MKEGTVLPQRENAMWEENESQNYMLSKLDLDMFLM